MKKNTICEVFLESVKYNSDKVAFHYYSGTWQKSTYNEILADIKGISSYLLNRGIKKGDRVAIISENRPEWCESYLAILFSGGIAVPVDAELGDEEIMNLLIDSDSRAVFYSSKTKENVKNAVTKIVSSSFFTDIIMIDLDSLDFRNNICKTKHAQIFPSVFSEDVASLIYTSGTTGIPKGVEITHMNFCSDADAVINAEIVTKKDSIICLLPLHHTYPFTCTFLIPIFLGISITFPPSIKGPELIQTIREKGITILVGVPQLLELIKNGMFNKIKQLPKPISKIMFFILKLCGFIRQKLNINMGKLVFKSAHNALGRNFRFFASGGAKLNPDIMKDLEALGFTVVEGYGLTETSPVVTFNPIVKRKVGSAGKALPYVEIKIIDPKDNKELGPFEEGEILIKGPMVMKGYYKNSYETKKVIKNGWLHTGDTGYLDEDEYLFITGRLKEIIVLSSGKKIYPDEIESKYLKIPYIKELCIIGLEGDTGGESLQAVIVPDFEYAKKANVGNLIETLKWELNDVSIHLPSYMRIKRYTIYPQSLPKTPLGKLRRFMIRDLAKNKIEDLKSIRKEDKQLLQDETGRKVIDCIKPLLKENIPIQSTDNLELDLGLDSLARVELVVCLEKTFSIKLPDTFASNIQTVEELLMKIKEHKLSKSTEVDKKPSWKEILKVEPESFDREKIRLKQNILEQLFTYTILYVVKILMRLLFRLKIEGCKNLPEKGPFIITPNHSSYLDGFAIISAIPSKLFKHFYSIGLQIYFRGPLKIFARLAHVIPIDRETYLQKAIQMASYSLRNNKSLLIFPEGGRSYNGELMEFKKGVGILSLELNIPVIPTYIKGSFEALPRGARWPKFSELKVIFGKPFYPSDLDLSYKPNDVDIYQFFANELKTRVEKLNKLQKGITA